MSVAGPGVEETPGRRQRRGSAEVDQLIVDTARQLFAESGYSATSLREVAERAGVHEPMVRRRYESKARLFEVAVLDPLDEAVSRYLAVQASQVEIAGPTENLTRSWVPPLYGVLRDERKLIFALMAADEYHAADFEASFTARIRQIVERMLPQARLEIERRLLAGIGLPENIVVSVGMLLGVALMDAERGFGLSESRLVEEMVQLTLYGVTGRAGDRDRSDRDRPDRDRSDRAPLVGDLGPEIEGLLDRVAAAERRAARAELERDMLRRQLGQPSS